MLDYIDAKMEQDWYFKCGWRSSFAVRISHVGNNLHTPKAKDFRDLLLYSSSLHYLCCLLSASCGILLFLHHATGVIPLLN